MVHARAHADLRLVGRAVTGLALVTIAVLSLYLSYDARRQATKESVPKLVATIARVEASPDGSGVRVKLLVENVGLDATTITAVHVQGRDDNGRVFGSEIKYFPGAPPMGSTDSFWKLVVQLTGGGGRSNDDPPPPVIEPRRVGGRDAVLLEVELKFDDQRAGGRKPELQLIWVEAVDDVRSNQVIAVY